MSDMNISIPAGEKKRLLTGGKYCSDDIVVEAGGGDTDDAFEAGRKAEREAFWNSFFANTTEYGWRFAGRGWNDHTFNPDRDIVFSRTMASYCFAQNAITDLEAILKRNNVVLDTSRSQRLDNLFYYSGALTCVPEIVIGNECINIGSMFCQCKALRTIRKLTFPDKTLSTNYYIFENCLALEEITIGGTIGCNGLDLHWSTMLNKASITSFINALSATTSGFTITFSETAVNNAFETSSGAADGSTSAEWNALVATKSNWTITLV